MKLSVPPANTTRSLSTSPRARTASSVAPKSITKAKSETSLDTQGDDKKLSVPTTNQKRSSLNPLTPNVKPSVQTKKSVKSLARSQAKINNEIAMQS